MEVVNIYFFSNYNMIICSQYQNYIEFNTYYVELTNVT